MTAKSVMKSTETWSGDEQGKALTDDWMVYNRALLDSTDMSWDWIALVRDLGC